MGFSRLDQTRYTFKIIKMVANNKVALLKACTSIMLSTIVKTSKTSHKKTSYLGSRMD